MAQWDRHSGQTGARTRDSDFAAARTYRQHCHVKNDSSVMTPPAPLTTASSADIAPPLVVHLLYRFAVGGLENGLVNLINHMPADRYRHAIVALTEYTDFCERLRRREAVQIFALHKKQGNDP